MVAYFIFLNLYPWYFWEFKTNYPSTWDTGFEPVVSTMQQSVVQIKIHLWGKLRVTSMNATCSYYRTILWFCGIEHQDGACGQGVISLTMSDTHWTMFEISGRNIFLEPFKKLLITWYFCAKNNAFQINNLVKTEYQYGWYNWKPPELFSYSPWLSVKLLWLYLSDQQISFTVQVSFICNADDCFWKLLHLTRKK